MIKLGNIELNDLKRGATFINKVYLGIQQIWQRFSGYQGVLAALPDGIITKNDMWYYRNYGTGGATADMLIKSTCGNFDGVSPYISGPIIDFNSEGFVVEVDAIFSTTTNATMYGRDYDYEFFRMRDASTIIWKGYQVQATLILLSPLVDGEYYRFRIEFVNDGTPDNVKLYIGGVLFSTTTAAQGVEDASQPWNVATMRNHNLLYDKPIFRYAMYRINGEKVVEYYFKEGAGLYVYDSSGNGNNGIIIFAAATVQPYPSQAFLQALAEFWGTKSEYAEPIEKFGYSNIIDVTKNTVAGLDVALGMEMTTNPFFNADGVGNLTIPAGAVGVNNNGILECITTDISNQLFMCNFVASGKYYEVDYELTHVSNPAFSLFGNSFSRAVGKYRDIVLATSKAVNGEGANSERNFNYFSVKEVTSIPAYGEWELSLKCNAGLLAFIADKIGALNTYNGYIIQALDNGVMRFLKSVDGGSHVILFETDVAFVSIDNFYEYKVERATDGTFSVYVKGNEHGSTYILIPALHGTNPILDNDFTETAFMISGTGTADIITVASIKDNGELLDTHNFNVKSGNADKIHIQSGSLDVPQLVAPNSGASNSGAELYQPDSDVKLMAVDTLNNLGWYDGSGVAQAVDWDILNSYINSPTFKLTKNGLAITNMTSADVQDAEEGSPLETHSLWDLINNEQGGGSHFKWRRYGKDIVPTPNPTPGASTQNVAYNKIESVVASVSGKVMHIPTGTTWALMFAKFIDAQNLIGVRINVDKIEIVQRSAGVWNTKYSQVHTDMLGRWVVTINTTTLKLTVNDALIAEVSHVITGIGNFGISGHRYDDNSDSVLIEDYNVVSLLPNPVQHDGEQVEHNGEGVFHGYK